MLNIDFLLDLQGKIRMAETEDELGEFQKTLTRMKDEFSLLENQVLEEETVR